jgi:hypothetical protein
VRGSSGALDFSRLPGARRSATLVSMNGSPHSRSRLFVSCAAAIALALGAEREARAVEIRDGEAFSVDVPQHASPCFVWPASLFDTKACPGLRPMDDPHQAGGRVLAVARVGGAHPLGQIIVTAIEMRSKVQPDDATAREFGKGAAKGMLDKMPGAWLREPATSGIVTVHGTPVARAEFAAGTGPKDAAVFQHFVLHAAWAPATVYSVMVIGSESDATALNDLAGEIADTLTLRDHLPEAPSASYRLGYALGQVFGFALPIGLLVALIAWARRRGARTGG